MDYLATAGLPGTAQWSPPGAAEADDPALCYDNQERAVPHVDLLGQLLRRVFPGD